MKSTTRDNLVYIGVALAVAAGFIFHMFYTERTTGKIQTLPGPVLWGILSTPGIAALILERYWKYRRQRWLWFLSCAAALINIGAILVALALRWSPPVLLWSVATVVYVMLAFRVADSIVVRENKS
jgi:phosphatidylserine synthase